MVRSFNCRWTVLIVAARVGILRIHMRVVETVLHPVELSICAGIQCIGTGAD